MPPSKPISEVIKQSTGLFIQEGTSCHIFLWVHKVRDARGISRPAVTYPHVSRLVHVSTCLIWEDSGGAYAKISPVGAEGTPCTLRRQETATSYLFISRRCFVSGMHEGMGILQHLYT